MITGRAKSPTDDVDLDVINPEMASGILAFCHSRTASTD